ncbi:MAG: aminotransferase class I/II-fold pyridoxal phosphate-dependent enzyme [Limisphaerales bacterium]
MLEPEPLQQINRTYVRYRQRKLSYFAGCDYFRLASHPRVIAALQAGVKKYGLNVAASRLTTGNHVLYLELEAQLADFFATESALLVSSGYVSNLVVAQALAGHFSHALIDAGSHSSLSDAARFLDCPVLQFKSRDAEALAGAVRRCGPGSRLLLLTDGMFSSDGSAAPLAEYLEVLPKDALLLVDDAHGAGVLGRNGQGAPEHAGVSRRRIIQTVTLSKSFGAYGGAILGTARLRQQILDRSRMFVGGTPLPLPLANAALAGVRILKADQSLRPRLFRNAAYVKTALRESGLPLAETPGPIVPLHPPSLHEAARLSRALLAARIYPPLIKYSGGPPGGYFRFVISSEHTRPQLDALLSVLCRYAKGCAASG